MNVQLPQSRAVRIGVVLSMVLMVGLAVGTMSVAAQEDNGDENDDDAAVNEPTTDGDGDDSLMPAILVFAGIGAIVAAGGALFLAGSGS